MVEALWYGFIAALTFIGIVAVLCLAVLEFFKSKGQSRYIIYITDDIADDEIRRLIYGTYLKALVFGNLIFDGINVVCCVADENKKELVHKTATEYGITVQYGNVYGVTGSGEEKNGDGAC